MLERASSASACLTWRTSSCSASAWACSRITCLTRSASETSRTSLIRSSSWATVFFHRDALANHIGDVLALLFQRLFLLDLLQLHLTLAGDDLQVLGAGDLLHLDDHRALAVLLRHLDLALVVLGAHVDFLLRLDPPPARPSAALLP